jgi:hypothetical protein
MSKEGSTKNVVFCLTDGKSNNGCCGKSGTQGVREKYEKILAIGEAYRMKVKDMRVGMAYV